MRSRAVDVDRRVEGAVDDVGADIDELAALRQLIDRAAIFLGIDDGRGRRGKPREIGGSADLLQRLVALEIGLERDGRGKLARADERRGRLIDARMHAFAEKWVGFEKGRNPVAGLVVDEDRAQKSLFGLEIVRRAR